MNPGEFPHSEISGSMLICSSPKLIAAYQDVYKRQRQSAVGLPFIRQRHYGDKDVSVTEYTMSEIISSVYAKMEATGLKEGLSLIHIYWQGSRTGRG